MLRHRRPRARMLASAVAAIGVVAALAVPLGSAAAADDLSLTVLSGRADTVTGGDALIAVDGADEATVVTADGRDVTPSFTAVNGRLIGLVEGLPLGTSEVTARSASGSETLEIQNHPASGPVFSGPQHPMYCTASGAPWNLGPTDEDCHVAEARVSFRYRTTGGAWADYPADGSTPGDVATATVEGRTVPYVVRVERGTINRAVYETAMLAGPADPAPTYAARAAGWNGKLAYTFGGACGVGYWQGSSTGGVENDMLLSRGYIVASATFNVFAQNCNDVTSAETAMMVKEHVIEQVGPVTYTIGSGGSAGTMQQLLLANNYPGIIDGVMGDIGYPDERTTTVAGHDCTNLLGFWASPAGSGWTDAQKLAVTGHAQLFTCTGFTWFTGVDNPRAGCNAAVPVGDRWSEANPDGLRCTIADMVQNVYGVDDQGRGLRVLPDNVGVQYGLAALQSGAISPEQFVALNENAGGMDVDGTRTSARSEASIEAIEQAYRTGRINLMTGGLAYTPVIEMRRYTDPTGDFHERYRSAIIRERMLDAYGNADTHVSWTSKDAGYASAMYTAGLDKLEEWLDNIVAMGGFGDRARTVAARPAGLGDGCYTDDGFVSEQLDYENTQSTCNQLFPYHSEPRYVAGESLSRDVLKCQLTAPVRADYPEMTDGQWERLTAAFPTGVCDWAKPSQGRVDYAGVRQSFETQPDAVLEAPVITGEARVGTELSVSASSATPGATLDYQWFADGVAIEGALSGSFTPGEAHEGAALTARVSVVAECCQPASRVSAATAPVAPVSSPSNPPSPSPSPSPSVSAWATVDVGDGRFEQGGTLVARVAGLTPGQRIAAEIRSDPYVLAGIPAADAEGRITIRSTIPASIPAGAHTLVIASGDLEPLRVPITIVPAGTLAATGGTVPWELLALGAGVLVLGAGAVVFARRRGGQARS